MAYTCLCACQVQIIHAEPDEEEVPEGFTLGFSAGTTEKETEKEQVGGGQKRAADEEVWTHYPIPSCPAPVPRPSLLQPVYYHCITHAGSALVCAG